ncbi:hypothetical protein AAG906_023450 [Vitis piasezkii]
MDWSHLQMQECPSFNSYSSDRLADVAAKVGGEECASDDRRVDEDNFEFTFVSTGEVLRETQIGPVFPVFNRDLLVEEGEAKTLRFPLKKLFMEERDGMSSSSSDADELEGIPEGTYCVWQPKKVPETPERCKKSSSTGSASKRWRFRDLLRRSNSEGKDSFVFLTPSKREEKAEITDKSDHSKETRNSVHAKTNVAGKAKPKVISGEKASPHEIFYMKNRAMKEGDKRQSFLPYRRDLVGFFANVSRMNKSFPL